MFNFKVSTFLFSTCCSSTFLEGWTWRSNKPLKTWKLNAEMKWVQSTIWIFFMSDRKNKCFQKDWIIPSHQKKIFVKSLWYETKLITFFICPFILRIFKDGAFKKVIFLSIKFHAEQKREGDLKIGKPFENTLSHGSLIVKIDLANVPWYF